jgi:hypothetical protein
MGISVDVYKARIGGFNGTQSKMGNNTKKRNSVTNMWRKEGNMVGICGKL